MAYGFDDSKSKVEVYTEAEVDTKLSAKQDKMTIDSALSSTSTNPVQNKVVNSALNGINSTLNGINSTLNGKQNTMKAGTGVALDGVTINHKNSVTAKTSYVGSATAVPRIMYDSEGHITGTTTATIYPPTTPGNAGQVWTSDGSGAGTWQTQRNITVSTSDPSGGNDGDIWYKYE